MRRVHRPGSLRPRHFVLPLLMAAIVYGVLAPFGAEPRSARDGTARDSGLCSSVDRAREDAPKLPGGGGEPTCDHCLWPLLGGPASRPSPLPPA